METIQESFYRLYYDAWVVRNVEGPGKPGDWVKMTRERDFDTLGEAVNFGQDITADQRPARPEGYHIMYVTMTQTWAYPTP